MDLDGIASIGMDYSAVALVVDRSGSMASVATDTKGGVKQFIVDQKQKEGKASFTLVQFDHEYQVLNDFSHLSQVNENDFVNQYVPRGSTALLDAIGRTVLEMDRKIEKSAQKPTRVIIAIITDGLENSSVEFTASKVRKLIEEKQAKGWDFLFLGANIDSIADAKTYGFDPKKIAFYDTSNMDESFRIIGKQVTAARNGEEVAISDHERAQLTAEK